MESSIVIKVKYQDTLRRFNARIVNKELDLNMDGLREKIVYLFKFAPDTQLNFTYNDEDNDVVALVDDEDLRDVVRQALNPLRITVSSSKPKSLSSSAQSSESSTPSLPPPLQGKHQNFNFNVSEILNSLREPLREPLSKLSSDLEKKASSYGASDLVEITDSFSKLGLHYLNQLSELPSFIEAQKSVGTYKDSAGLKKFVATTEVTSGVSVEEPTTKSKKVMRKSESLIKNDGVIFEGVPQPAGTKGSLAASGSGNTTTSQPIDPVVPNAHVGSLVASGSSNTITSQPVYSDVPNAPVASMDKQEVKGTSDTAGVKYFGSSPVANDGSSSGMDYSRRWWHPSYASQTTSVEGWRNKKSASGMQSSSVPLVPPPPPFPFIGMPVINDKTIQSSSVPLVPAPSPFPFIGMPVINDTAIMHDAPNGVPGRSYNYSHGIFHRGVRCDGCGIHPITGPRFKSKVRKNYDLCSICFSEMGNDADFMRIEHPESFRRPLPFKGSYSNGRGHTWTLPREFKDHGAESTPLDLDSSFILDVNILDGTIMPPMTRFTKIWRMRNNGTTVWPQGTRLVWIGGVRMEASPSIELEIGATGVHANQELDVSADFVAPELHGRHISYWRMALPSGQKFGQRVWVLIEVDASLKNPMPPVARPGFNLNFPPASESVTTPKVDVPIEEPVMNRSLPEMNVSNASVQIVGVPTPEPTVNQSLPEPPNTSNTHVERVEPLVNGQMGKEQEAKFPIDDSLLVGMAILASEEVDTGNQTEEEKLLKELEEMGFKQTALNKEILRMNKYDLEQTIDDLCGGSEWEPILAELEDMGFYDRVTNKRLLRKNDGSIKRVVMDLIGGETE